MKKKNILFATCLLGAFAFSSCEKNLYDESKQSEKEIKMTDLEIPANFPWETSKDAKCKIVSSINFFSVYILRFQLYPTVIYGQYRPCSSRLASSSTRLS